MNTLSGASNNERDTQDKSPEEPRQEHDTQDTPMKSLETQNPTCPGGTLSGCVWWLGAALAGLITLELHRRQSTDHVAEMKNEER